MVVTFQTGVNIIGEPTYTSHIIGMTNNKKGKRQNTVNTVNHK